MKLDKRYVTTIDLSRRTTTGDREGDAHEPHEPVAGRELEDALAGLRGDVELAIPAASAVKIDGERAYRLHRRGVEVEMPTRVMRVYELEAIGHEGATLEIELHVGSGTYVRSIADALGGHCVALRRTQIGPFGVHEADALAVVDLAEVLPRLAGWATPQ
jgi:tRNA pseudouridine55 synthase